MLERILMTLFKYEEINGAHRCPTYLHRWTLFQPRWPKALWKGFGIYIHKFVGDDWSRDLHDHPKRFISIGLRGQYREEVFNKERLGACSRGDDGAFIEPRIYPCGCSRLKVDAGRCDIYSNTFRIYRAPWVRTFPADHTHRLSLIDRRPCWTLVIVLRNVRAWGFWSRMNWIPWRDYVAPGNAVADARKACP